MTEIGIAGAGFAGAVLARKLAESDKYKITLFDERNHIAGNCHTVRDQDTAIMVRNYGRIFSIPIAKMFGNTLISRSKMMSELMTEDFAKAYGLKYGILRDYVHVVDLAKAHILALHSLDSKSNYIFNIGSEHGFSVREIIAACQKVTAKQFQIKEENRRPVDPAVLIANSQKVQRVLGSEISLRLP